MPRLFFSNSFNLEASSACVFDVLRIYDGVDRKAVSLYCGTDGPKVITGWSGTLIVEFRSDPVVTGSGFTALAAFLSECANIFFFVEFV